MPPSADRHSNSSAESSVRRPRDDEGRAVAACAASDHEGDQGGRDIAEMEARSSICSNIGWVADRGPAGHERRQPAEDRRHEEDRRREQIARVDMDLAPLLQRLEIEIGHPADRRRSRATRAAAHRWCRTARPLRHSAGPCRRRSLAPPARNSGNRARLTRPVGFDGRRACRGGSTSFAPPASPATATR